MSGKSLEMKVIMMTQKMMILMTKMMVILVLHVVKRIITWRKHPRGMGRRKLMMN